MAAKKSFPKSYFKKAYTGSPAWEIQRPQKAVIKLMESAQLRGRGLDIGCGTGANTIAMAKAGIEAVGIDAVPDAILLAKKIARKEKAKVQFRLADACTLEGVKGDFDFALDSGLFHCLSDRDRNRYAKALTTKLRCNANLFIIAFSPDEKSKDGPRRISLKDIQKTFPEKNGWRLNSVTPTVYETTNRELGAKAQVFSLTLLLNKEMLKIPKPKVSKAIREMEVPIALTSAHGGFQTVVMDADAIASAQVCPNWCWAAALEMLCKSQGIELKQQFFVEKIYGKVNGQLPCLPSGSLETISIALKGTSQVINGQTVTLTAPFHYGIPKDVLGMVTAIQEKRPFIFGHNGHAYVCYGMTWYQENNFIQITRLELIDPLWKLDPNRTKTTFFAPLQAPAILWAQINGTLELVVKKS